MFLPLVGVAPTVRPPRAADVKRAIDVALVQSETSQGELADAVAWTPAKLHRNLTGCGGSLGRLVNAPKRFWIKFVKPLLVDVVGLTRAELVEALGLEGETDPSLREVVEQQEQRIAQHEERIAQQQEQIDELVRLVRERIDRPTDAPAKELIA